MKFGTLYSYWGTEWQCDYVAVANKVADIGFDILEIGADHLYHMSNDEITNLKAAGDERGLIFTTNSGPSRENDLASVDSAVRQHGIDYFTKILHNMDKLGSKSLVGAIYSFWPCDFVEIDKEAAWDRSIKSMKVLGKTAEELGIECSLEVLNRYETFILTDCAEAKEYCRRVGSKNVNILLDTFHMNIEEDNIPDAIRLAGDMLGHLHVGEGNRKLPGMGSSIDWDSVGKALKDINYNKGIVMEPFMLTGGAVARDIKVWRDLSNGADEATMTKNIAKSLSFLKSKFK
jgi:D-psicose/D-tagatose/L-ribulose 3-epimerase